MKEREGWLKERGRERGRDREREKEKKKEKEKEKEVKGERDILAAKFHSTIPYELDNCIEGHARIFRHLLHTDHHMNSMSLAKHQPINHAMHTHVIALEFGIAGWNS